MRRLFALAAMLTTAPILGAQSLSPPSLAFGTVATSSTLTMTFSTGGASITLNNIHTTSSNGSDFSQTNNCIIPPNTSCTITVTFTPTAPSGTNETGTVFVGWTTGGSITANLTGTSGTSGGSTVTIDWTNVHQVIDGFGANDFDDAGSATPTLLTSAQANLLFGTGNGQIGLSILRTGVPDNKQNYSMGNCTSVGSSCAGVYAPDFALATSLGARIYVTPFAVPDAYSTNGSGNCNGSLATAHYADFANWLMNFVKSIQQGQGANVAGITLQNEPDFCGGTSPETAWSATQIQTFIQNNLGPTFQSNGLSSVLIFEPETSRYNLLNNLGFECAGNTNPTCASFLGGFSTHDYGASVTIPTDTVSDAPLPAGWTSAGGRYWMSEVSCNSGGALGFCTAAFDPSMNNALGVAALIDHRLAVNNMNAWLWWWLLLPASVGNGEALYANDTGVVPLRTYVMGQYSRFIRPGYFRIDATHAPRSGVSASAYQNTTGGNLVIVGTNYTASPVTLTFNVLHAPNFMSVTPYITSGTAGQTILALSPQAVSGNAFTYTLPAQSVISFVGTSSGQSTFPLTVTVTGTGTVTGNGINCPGTCTATVATGTAVVLTQAGGGGSTFAGWNGAPISCTVSGATCSFTMPATSESVTATFTGGSSLWAGILDQSRAIDWRTAGVQGGIPSASWTQCGSTLASTSTSAQIQAAINACGINQYVLLGAGTFPMTTGLIMKSNVALRGAGANNTILDFSNVNFQASSGCQPIPKADICMTTDASTFSNPGQANTATWSGGYSQGATSITVSSVVGSITNGQFIFLDQANVNADNGNFFSCDNTTFPCSLEGGSLGRTERTQSQTVQVISGCATACTGAGPFTLTITPGLFYPNWASALSPGAWWPAAPVQYAGLENFTIINSLTGQVPANIGITNGFNCWVTGVRSEFSTRANIWVYKSGHNTIQNNYFYGTVNAASQSYAVEEDITSSDLIVQNIFQHVTTPIQYGTGSGNVIAYNYEIYSFNNSTVLIPPFSAGHDAGTAYNLYEGNISAELATDVQHGTHGFHTAFRNAFLGWEPTFLNGLIAVQILSYSRYHNIIGNVLGTPGITNTYLASGIFNGVSGSGVYILANVNKQEGTVTVPVDPQVSATIMRWGNYDSFNQANRFVASEVPSGISPYGNALPASQGLPPSFAFSSQPSWLSGKPWPIMGPDVTGGNVGQCTSGTFIHAFALASSQCAGGTFASGVNAGHINSNPAMDCYFNNMGGTTDGTGPVLPFNPSICYPVGAGTVSVAPSSENFGSVTIGQSSSTQTATLTNTALSSITISSVSTTGANAADFPNTANTCSGTVAANGGTCVVTTQFTPSSTGAESATLTITTSAGSFPVALSGTGVSATLPGISLSPAFAAFGNISVGLPSAGTTITITSTTSTNLVMGTPPAVITGTNASDFSLQVVAGVCTSGASIPQNSTCVENVVFTPSAAGARSATLSIFDNVTGSPQTVALTGTGVGVIAFNPASLNFGNIAQGVISPSQTLTLTNNTGVTITFTTMATGGYGSQAYGSSPYGAQTITTSTSFTNPDFGATSNTCTGALTTGSSCQVVITFRPSSTTGTNETGVVTFAYTGVSGPPSSVSLAGTVLAPIGTPANAIFATNLASCGKPQITTLCFTSDGHIDIAVCNPVCSAFKPFVMSVTGAAQ